MTWRGPWVTDAITQADSISQDVQPAAWQAAALGHSDMTDSHPVEVDTKGGEKKNKRPMFGAAVQVSEDAGSWEDGQCNSQWAIL